MKLQHIILAGLAIAMVATSCEESRINPGDNGYNQDTIYVAPPMPDPTAAKAILDSLPDSLVLTVQQARDTCRTMSDGETTATEYYVKGWVCALDAKNAEGIENYGNATFYMGVSYLSQVKHSFEAFQVYGKDKKKIVDPKAIKVGDFVIVKSKLRNYGGVAETTDKGSAYIYYSTNENYDPIMDTTKITPDPKGADVPIGTINVYQALKISDELGIGNTSTETYYIKGWISKLDSKNADGIANFGNATFYIAATNDGTTNAFTFEAYQVYGKDGKKITDPNQVAVGDFVVLKSKIKNFNGVAETTDKGSAYIYYSTNKNYDPIMDTTKITPDPAGVDVPAGTLSVYQALKISDELGIGNTSTETYYIKGWISKLDSKNADGIANFGNATFYIAATNDGTTNAFTFEAYQVYGKNGKRITNLNQVEVGDFVVLKSKIKNFNGVAETTDKGSASIYSSSNTNFNAEFNK